MKNDDPLNQQLNRPTTPDRLEDKIRANWSNQLASQEQRWSKSRMLAAALIFALIPGLIFTSGIYSAPGIVLAAINDIAKDQSQGVGLNIAVSTILRTRGINLPPESMPVVLTKYCRISGNQTTHMKIAGRHKGFVHLFIQREEHSTGLMQANQGIIDSMPWKIINPRPNLSVLVLYTSDMNPTRVDDLIRTMFSA